MPPSCSMLHVYRYVMRYIAMQLRLLLQAKFPEAPEDDILKVVGNLLYYRYMNPAIVAPDAFDVVDISVEQQLSPDQVSWLEALGLREETVEEGSCVVWVSLNANENVLVLHRMWISMDEGHTEADISF